MIVLEAIGAVVVGTLIAIGLYHYIVNSSQPPKERH